MSSAHTQWFRSSSALNVLYANMVSILSTIKNQVYFGLSLDPRYELRGIKNMSISYVADSSANLRLRHVSLHWVYFFIPIRLHDQAHTIHIPTSCAAGHHGLNVAPSPKTFSKKSGPGHRWCWLSFAIGNLDLSSSRCVSPFAQSAVVRTAAQLKEPVSAKDASVT